MKRIIKHYQFLEHKKINYFFFGVGVTMFLLNIITIINLVMLSKTTGHYINFSLGGYYISILSSVILTSYSVYNLLHEEEE